jgi:DNA mismatch endonuclease (patch repair protein)
MDTLSPRQRSENMRRIRSQDTKPELLVRKYLHGRGLRFRLNNRDLPGRPDIVFPSRRTCVFVHGCFWHGCERCVDGTRAVKSHTDYWRNKVGVNRARDRLNESKLTENGWNVLTIWECETTNAARLSELEKAIRSQPIRNRKGAEAVRDEQTVSRQPGKSHL